MRGWGAVAHKDPQKKPKYSDGPKDVKDRGPSAIKAVSTEQGRDREGDNATNVRTYEREGGRRERERERERGESIN